VAIIHVKWSRRRLSSAVETSAGSLRNAGKGVMLERLSRAHSLDSAFGQAIQRLGDRNGSELLLSKGAFLERIGGKEI